MIINRLEIKNYKSFLQEDFSLDHLTTIVGANESGKSNVLKAINHFSKVNQNIKFGQLPGDLRLDSPDFPNGEIAITCDFVLGEGLIPNLVKIEPSLTNKVFRLEKKGKLNQVPTISGSFVSDINDVTSIIKISNKSAFKTKLNGIIDTNLFNFGTTNSWFFKDQSVNLTKNPFASMLKEGELVNLDKDKDGKSVFLAEQIKKEVLNNIKILFWEYKESEHYLPESVLISDFIANPSKYIGLDCIFAISGWKRDDYSRNLVSSDSITKNQLLATAQSTVNNLIKDHWTTHKGLNVKLDFNGEYIKIFLTEPGHQTPPNFRSDGFKWFLSFLLFFKRHASSLKGHILLIDEPGGVLHPRGQKDVLEELISLSLENQVIYTTHQTFLIDKNKQESIRIIKREKRNSGNAPIYDSKVYNLTETKHILTDKLLRESLGFLVSDISPLNEKNILVEGEFDRELLIEANKYFRLINLNEISIIGCGMASNIRKWSTLYSSCDLDIVEVYDADDPGLKSFNISTSRKKINLSNLKQNGLKTSEDLLPLHVFMEGLNNWKKEEKIDKNFTGNFPRMVEVSNELSGDSQTKIEQKHSLENFLIKSVRDGLKKNYKEFTNLEDLLGQIDSLFEKKEEQADNKQIVG